jgi:hypothetical protein
MSAKQTGAIFLTRSGIDIYTTTLEDILHYTFPATLVQDIEVINREELVNQIALLFQTNNITGNDFTILVYDDLLFSKEFKNDPSEKGLEEIKKFISGVPFEYTLVKQIKTKENIRVFTTNETLIESAVEGCQKNDNFVSFASISYYALQGVDLTNGFTKQVAEVALKKTDQIKQYSFISEEKSSYVVKRDEDLPFLKNPKNRRTILLLGVFVVLIVILIIVYFISTSSNTPPTAEETVTPNTGQSITPTPTPSITIDSPDEIRIQIRTGNLERFSQLQTALNELNFQTIELDTQNVTLGSRTTVFFDPSVSSTLQQNILEIVRVSSPDVTVQINQVGSYHVVITLP